MFNQKIVWLSKPTDEVKLFCDYILPYCAVVGDK